MDEVGDRELRADVLLRLAQAVAAAKQDPAAARPWLLRALVEAREAGPAAFAATLDRAASILAGR